MQGLPLVLQRKPFAFELFFCLAIAGFFTFSSKTCSIVPTCIRYLERTDKNTSIYTANPRWHTLKHL